MILIYFKKLSMRVIHRLGNVFALVATLGASKLPSIPRAMVAQKVHFQIQLAMVCLAIFASTASAEISLSKILSDGAILQRDEAIIVCGKAGKGEQVELRLDGEKIATTRAYNGKLSFSIPAQKAGGPHVLEFIGDNHVTLKDIYFGDVWLASGQSNMELPMARVKYAYPKEIATANNNLIRQFTVPREYDFNTPRDDYSGGTWVAANAKNIEAFSAVAYFFAISIQQNQKIPIGIINSAVGGSTVEGWMSERGLKQFPSLLNKALVYRDKEYLASVIAQDKTDSDNWYANIEKNDKGFMDSTPWYSAAYNANHWAVMDVPGYWADTPIGLVSGAVWFRKEIDLAKNAAGKSGQLWLGRIVDADTVYINGVEIGSTSYQYPPRIYSVPSGLLKEGKNTIVVRVISNSGRGGFVPDKPYWLRLNNTKIKLSGPWQYRVGVIASSTPAAKFVQYLQPLGYHNAMIAPLYDTKIKGVIWYQGESNVGRAQEYKQTFAALIDDWRGIFNKPKLPFVFVQLANYGEPQLQPADSEWAQLREVQRQALIVDDTAMVVAIDTGEWNDIHPVNKKDVGERMALAARKLAYGEQALVASGPEIQCITVNDTEVTLRFSSVGAGLKSKGSVLAGFAIAGADKKFTWRSASIKSENEVVLDGKDLKPPLTVRYAWADNPSEANLYNAEGLPASPFEVDRKCPKS